MKNFLLVLMALPLAAQTPQAKSPVPRGAGLQPATEQAEPPAPQAEPSAPQVKAEQWLTGTLDVGYRWVGKVGGDFNTYRSVVNLGEGPKLFGADLTFEDPSRRLFDRVEVRAHSWGGDPYNTARIDARKAGLYDFSFDYRNIAYFNFLPSFDTPGRERGFFLNQLAFDTLRRSRDFRLDLFPGRRITPYFAYQRNVGHGSGVTNLGVDANEYPLRTRLYDRADDYRGGFRFQLRRFHLTLEQGGINYADDQSVYSTEPQSGNVTAPFFGRPLSLASGQQLYHIRADSLYSRGLFTANPFSWVDLYGQFLYSRPHSTARLTQQNTGNFFDFSALAFYTTQMDAIAGEARRPHTSGSFSAELRPVRRVRIVESWMTDRLHNAGSEALAEQLLAGASTVSVLSYVLPNLLVVNYNQQQLDLMVDVLRGFALRGGHRYVWGNAQTPTGLTNLFIGDWTTTKLRRHVGLAGASLRLGQKFRGSLDFEASPGDRAFFRISINDYQKARFRARYQVLPSLLLAGSAGLLRNENPIPGVNYDFLSRDQSLSVNWNPWGGDYVSLLADYSRSTVHSDIYYRVPRTLARELSFYRERAHSGTALVDVKLPSSEAVKPKLTVGGSLFASGGTRPARYYQPLARAAVGFKDRLEWNWEWRWYALSQQLYLFEGFRTHQFTTGLRLRL